MNVLLNVLLIIFFLLLLFGMFGTGRPPRKTSYPRPKPVTPKPPQKIPILRPEPSKNYDLKRWKRNTISEFDDNYSLIGLFFQKNIEDINYGNLIFCFEWRFKRFRILMRDSFKCNLCDNTDLSNHVHHKLYIKDRLPWDIEDSALQTLCRKCHAELHEKFTIPVFEIRGNSKFEVSRENPYCYRCGGIGYIHQFHHVENGICFACRGNLLSKKIFYKGLKKFEDDFDKYPESKLREDYRNYLNRITSEEFRQSWPELSNYEILKQEDRDDDLPFLYKKKKDSQFE